MHRLSIFLQKETTRNFMKLFSGTMVAQGMSLLLAPVLSRLFTPEDFGLVALYLGILSVLSVITTAKYEQAIMLPRHEMDAVRICWLVMGITTLVSLATCLIVVLFNKPLALLSGNPGISPWLYVLPLSLFLHGLTQTATFFANRRKRFGLMAAATVAQYTLLNAVRVAAGWVQSSYNGLISGQLAGQAIAAAYMSAGVYKDIRQTGNGRTIINHRISMEGIMQQARIYIGYPKFNMPLNFTNNLSGSLPIFMLTWGFSPAIAGLYAFGYTFVFRPIGLFSQSTLQVLSQKIISDHHHGIAVYPALRKLAGRLLLAAILPATVLTIAAPALFAFAFSEEYRMAGTFLQYLSPYLVMVFVTSPLAFVPELFFRQKKAMAIDMVYLLLRFAALAMGIYLKNVYLAMALFGAFSTLVVSYNLYWYLSLARQGDNKLSKP